MWGVILRRLKFDRIQIQSNSNKNTNMRIFWGWVNNEVNILNIKINILNLIYAYKIFSYCTKTKRYRTPSNEDLGILV